MPFVDSAELALILADPHATIHRALAGLLADGIVGRVSHGTAHLPSSQRYYLTAWGISEAPEILGFQTPSDFVRAYPVSREWLALLIRRMDAVAAVYRLASSLSPGVDGLRSHVEFHRRGRFDATITLHDGRSFGVVRQGLALRRRSLYDRLRAIAEYDYTRCPDATLILTPSNWEQGLTTRFCMDMAMRDCYVGVESRGALESRDNPFWQRTSFLFGGRFCSLETVSSHGSPGGAPLAESPSRKRASIPRAERMVQAAPTSGVSPSEKCVLDLVTDHPVITREAPCSLAWRLGGTGQPDDAQPRRYLGPGRATRKARRHPLHLVIQGHTLHYPPRPSPTPDDAGHLEHSPHHRPSGPETARGRGRRNTQTGSHGSSRSLRPRPGPTLTASSCGPSHRQVRPRLQLGPVGHRSRTPWDR